MGDLLRLFSPEELKALDPRDLEILRITVPYVLSTDEDIRRTLENRVREVLRRIQQIPSPQPPPGP
jgi:hypothetical protein